MARAGVKAAARRKVTFRYEAESQTGRRVKGTITTSSEMAAQNELVDKGYDSINLFPAAAPMSLEGALPSMFKVNPTQIISFARQLATLLEAGVTLLPAIQLLGQQRSSSPPFRRILGHVINDLSTGNSLSYALSRHGDVFSEVFRRTVEVGERTGDLQTVLRQLAHHTEQQAVMGKKLKSAMTAPTIMAVVGIAVALLLVTVVLPPLSDLFATMEEGLPLPTVIMMGLSNFVISYAMPLIVVVGIAALAIPFYLRTERGAKNMDWLKFNIPVLGTVIVMGELARMARTMSLMLDAGLPLQDTMEIIPRTSSNVLFRDRLERLRQQLFLGEGLAYPMAAMPVFPPLMLQMVRVGEDSNTLGVTMGVVADFYETAAADKTNAMVALLTPATTVGMASFVGFVALSVIMPLSNLTQSF